ncbi:MAG: hypothetical protein FJZ01_09050 [Candidatus Sericytochromatia bacterium]|nr:hypothetical protein [Candidatus Tanganyikabacteria bacterium]
MTTLGKRLVAFGSILACTLAAPPALAQAPGADWVLIDSQTVRYFLPDPAAPPGSGTDSTSALLANPSQVDWILLSTDKVRYFQADGGVTEQQLGSSTEEQSVKVDSVQQADAGTSPRKSAIYEPPKKEWKSTGTRRTLEGRSVVRTVTYKVPQYQDVEYPYLKIDRYKKQARTITRVAVTSTGNILYSSHPDIKPTDAGSTRIEKREGPWRDAGPVPDPALARTVGRGFDPPVKELIGSKDRDVEEGRIAASATDLSEASKAGGGQGIALTTGRAEGSEEARSGGNSRVVQIAGSERAAARGGAGAVDLRALASLGDSFWGSKGNKTLFYFRLADSGSSKLLSIYPVGAGGKVDAGSAASWLLTDQFKLAGPQAGSRGISAAIGGAQQAGNKVKLTGYFQNKITGEQANSLDLAAAGGN